MRAIAKSGSAAYGDLPKGNHIWALKRQGKQVGASQAIIGIKNKHKSNKYFK